MGNNKNMKVLVCNVGSTSLKFKLYDMPGEQVLAECRIERVGKSDDAVFRYQNCGTGFDSGKLERQSIPTYTVGITRFLDELLGKNGVISSITEVERVGFKTAVSKDHHGIYELDEDTLQGMKDYLDIAPAHNAPYLEAIYEFKKLLPEAFFVGTFETAFHATIPLHRKMYGIPYEWYEKYGIMRLGYHGTSHSYVADWLTRRQGNTGRLISCHLGGSGSICAIQDGKSVDTSFGLTLQSGLIHSSRVGDMDPFVIPFLINRGIPLDEICKRLVKDGGLKGISGVSEDLRYVEEAAGQGNERAELALNVYCDGIVKYIGMYYAELGGLDALAFTGGIGENSRTVRGIVCSKLEHMGIRLDSERNQTLGCDAELSLPESPVKIYIIAANEEIVVARKTYGVE